MLVPEEEKLRLRQCILKVEGDGYHITCEVPKDDQTLSCRKSEPIKRVVKVAVTQRFNI